MKRQFQILNRPSGGKPAYTYGYNAEIIKTKSTLEPKKTDLYVKPA